MDKIASYITTITQNQARTRCMIPAIWCCLCEDNRNIRIWTFIQPDSQTVHRSWQTTHLTSERPYLARLKRVLCSPCIINDDDVDVNYPIVAFTSILKSLKARHKNLLQFFYIMPYDAPSVCFQIASTIKSPRLAVVFAQSIEACC